MPTTSLHCIKDDYIKLAKQKIKHVVSRVHAFSTQLMRGMRHIKSTLTGREYNYHSSTLRTGILAY